MSIKKLIAEAVIVDNMFDMESEMNINSIWFFRFHAKNYNLMSYDKIKFLQNEIIIKIIAFITFAKDIESDFNYNNGKQKFNSSKIIRYNIRL